MKIRLPNSPTQYDREDQDRLRRAIEAAFETQKLDITGGGTGVLSVKSGDAVFALGIGTIDWSSADFGLSESPTGELNVLISTNISRVGHVHDAADVTTGILTRARLPSQIAYEDEANTFTLTNTFSTGLVVGTDTTITNQNIGQSSNAVTLQIAGGTSGGSGNIVLFGGAHATNPNELRFRQGTSIRWTIATSTGHLLAGVDATHDIGAAGATRPRSIYLSSSVVTPSVNSEAATAMNLGAAGTNRWQITTTGHLIALTDNTLDIGQSSANRPRTGYFGTSVNIGAGVAFGGFVLNVNAGSGPIMVQNAGRLDVRSYNSSAAADEKLTDVWSQDGASGAQSFAMALARTDAAVLGHQGIVLFRSGSTWTTMRLMQSGGVVTIGTEPGGTETLRVGGSGRFDGTIITTGASAQVVLDNRNTPGTDQWLLYNQEGTSLRFYKGADIMRLSATVLRPNSNGLLALGTTTERWGKLWGQDADFSSGPVYVSASTDGPFQGDAYTDTASAAATFLGRRARVGPAAVQTNDVLSGVYGAGYHSGGGFGGFVAAVRLIAEEGFTSSAQGSRIEFATTAIGATTRTARWTITQSGSLTSLTSVTKIIAGATSLALRNTADSADNLLLTDAGLATFRNNVTINTAGATDGLLISRPTGTPAGINLATSGSLRWGIYVTEAAESGSDAGSNFRLRARTDSAAIIDDPITITRAAGGPITLTRDLIISSLGRFDSTDTPLESHVLLYHAGSTNKWQAESLQLIYNAGDAAVALLADNTSTQFLYFDPGAGADSPVGAPPTPVLQLFATHKGVTVASYASTAPDVFYHDGPSFPADFRHFLYEYSTDNFAADTRSLATASSDKVNHGRLTVGTTYYYRARAVDRAGNASANSAVVSFVAVASSDTSNFGVVLATEIAVDRLAALSANIGIITAGQLRNTGNTAGVNLGGAGGIPGTWTAGINFESAAGSGSMTRYINFTATGSNPVFKHEKMSLNADGTASFAGLLDITNAPLSFGFGGAFIVFRDADVAHGMTTQVDTNVLGIITAADDLLGGWNVVGWAESTATAASFQGYNVSASVSNPIVRFDGGKKSGTTVAAAAATDLMFSFANFGTRLIDIFGDGLLSLASGGGNGISIVQTNPSTRSPFLITQGEVGGSNTFSGIGLESTWNTSGSPTLVRANVVNTASGADALLLDLLVGGTSKFKIAKDGTLTINGGNAILGGAYVEVNEIGAPSTPAANSARLYAKDEGGTSWLFFKDDAGFEHAWGLNLIDTQTFTATGAGTWTKPDGAKLVRVVMWGAGGPGGGGRGGAAGTVRQGGSGGGGGAHTERWYHASDLGATEALSVGAGGSGGNGGSSADGGIGTTSTDSWFGNATQSLAKQWAFAGANGAGGSTGTSKSGGGGGGALGRGTIGTTTDVGGGAPGRVAGTDGSGYGGAGGVAGAHGRPSYFGGASGGGVDAVGGAGFRGGMSVRSAGGGGAGGGVTSGNVGASGGAGGDTGGDSVGDNTFAGGGGAGGVGGSGSTAGTNGANGDAFVAGQGGGGGGGDTNSTGSAGAAGGTPGGGGGGGGGGTTVGGQGGSGARGEIRVYSYA